MTFRSKTRRARLFPADERRDSLVILGFAGLIVLLGVGLVLAFGLSYYEQNVRPLARVGSREISPALVRDRGSLVRERILRDQGRLRVLQTNNEIDVATLNREVEELNSRQSQITTDSITEGLIDLLYQSDLAVQEVVTPSDADIAAALDAELATPERRHILLISIKPESTGDARPSVVQRAAAIDRANQALAELATSDWATVAAKYSIDPGAATGGDGGTISENNPTDDQWVKALFELPAGGTTRVIASLGCARADGGDCLYRIGRVAEVIPGTPDTAYRDKVLAAVSEDRLREIVGWELTAERLRNKIVGQVTTGLVDQVHLAEIIIRDTESGDEEEPGASPSPSPAPSATPDPAAQGEVHYSQILFAPRDDPEGAPDLPADDPSWTTAKNDADIVFNELNALTDAQARSDRFAELAMEKSDDAATKEDGGDIAFVTRDIPPTEVAKLLFDSQHQNGDLLAPVRDEFGWYVLLFHERRGTPQERLAQLQAELAAGADWNTLVEKYTDADEADRADGGDIGWYSRDMLKQVEDETVDKLFALEAGEVSEPIVFGTDSLIFKALDHTMRELDPNQFVQLTDPDFGAFSDWYSDKKTQAETDRVIVRTGEEALPQETPTASP